jgi:hypothetical protein
VIRAWPGGDGVVEVESFDEVDDGASLEFGLEADLIDYGVHQRDADSHVLAWPRQ